MNRRLTTLSLIAGLAIAALGVAPAAASANTVQIGSNLKFPAVAGECTPPCVGVQTAASPSLTTLVQRSPANGTIVSWSVRSDDLGALYTLRILRQGSSTSYTSAGQSPAIGPVPSATDTVYTYPASLPISNGDHIGLEVVGGSGLPDHFTGDSGDVVGTAASFPDGTSATFTDTTKEELLLQATVKYCLVPNVHKQKKVAAKNALAAADCGVKVKKKVTHKKKFRGKVLKQKKSAGSTFPPGTVVPIVIGQK
jgi:hypothetical protein